MQLSQDTRESAPQKLDTVNTETKEPATTKAPAKKAKKEKPKENWWSRFFK